MGAGRTIAWVILLAATLMPMATAAGPAGDPMGARLAEEVVVDNVTQTSAELHWMVLDECGPSYVSYRAEGADAWRWANQSSEASGRHAARLRDLEPATAYEWEVTVPAWCGIGPGGHDAGSFRTVGARGTPMGAGWAIAAVTIGVIFARSRK